METFTIDCTRIMQSNWNHIIYWSMLKFNILFEYSGLVDLVPWGEGGWGEGVHVGSCEYSTIANWRSHAHFARLFVRHIWMWQCKQLDQLIATLYGHIDCRPARDSIDRIGLCHQTSCLVPSHMSVGTLSCTFLHSLSFISLSFSYSPCLLFHCNWT